MKDCVAMNEVLGLLTAVFSLLFGVSEYLGHRKPEGCTSVVGFLKCKCLVVAEAVVTHVSPRTSMDGTRQNRRSCDIRASKELTRVLEDG